MENNNQSRFSAMYDLVINHGRIMDPLTRVDAEANLGILNGKIAALVPGDQALQGKIEINAHRLIVAPGFINIHGHGSGYGPGAEFHVRDGITTEITGNCGFSGGWSGAAGREAEAADTPTVPLADWFSKLETQKPIINLASYSGHNSLREAVGVTDPFGTASGENISRMARLVSADMEAGALGVTFGPFYAPGSRYEEMLALAKEASRFGGGSASHVRTPPRSPVADMGSIDEALSMAREAELPFLISHMGAPHVARINTGAAMDYILEARETGLQVATDCHPYGAYLTSLGAAIFETPRDDYSDVEVATSVVIDGEVVLGAGESFQSPEQFQLIRKNLKSGRIEDPGVIGHIYPLHKTFLWLSSPLTMVENDAAIRVDLATGRYGGHPRGAGSFARFLGYWVRERGVCDLMTALAKTSTMAAVWLGLDNKGRVQVGCDADLTLFDAETIIDRASYAEPGQPSAGIPHVIVAGVPVVAGGELTGNSPGTVIRRTWEIPGALPGLGGTPRNGLESLIKKDI